MVVPGLAKSRAFDTSLSSICAMRSGTPSSMQASPGPEYFIGLSGQVCL